MASFNALPRINPPLGPDLTAPRRALASVVTPAVTSIDTTEYVLTPNGYYHRSCVYEVPEGAKLKRGIITHRDGTSYAVPTCLHPGPLGGGAPGLRLGGGGNGLPVPSTHGWVTYGYNFTASGQTIRHVGARWIVPQIPASYGGGTNFLFPGAQNSNTIVQPVLQYGPSSAGGGQYWTVTGWMCGPTCAHGILQQVNVGDVLGGTVDASNCFGGGCDWAITVYDSTLSHSTTLVEGAGSLGSETDDNYNFAVGGALEIWNLSVCNHLTGGKHLFSQISFKDNNGSTFAPTWLAGRDTAVVPKSRGYGATSSGSSNLTVLDSLASVLTASIAGPSSVMNGDSGTWDAGVGLPGTPPYTYSWGGILGGSGSSTSGSPPGSGYLDLRIVDAAADTAYASFYVTVCDPGVLIC
ncbi:MAG TPA: hypothetical protein VII66_01970 [Gemmatimonadaceae bacterium]